MKRDLNSVEENFLVIVYLISALSGLVIVISQVIDWLHTSIWQPIPSKSFFDYFELNISFIYNPTDWLGAAKIACIVLDWPLALVLPAIIIAFAHILVNFTSTRRSN